MSKNEIGEKSSKISIYSFFSCSGFLDLGFELAEGRPFRLRMANEIDPNFRQCYRYARLHLNTPINVTEDFIFENSIEDFILRKGLPKKNKTTIYDRFNTLLSEDRKCGNLIGFIGGPPCPDFSVAGKNLGQKGDVGPLSSRYIKLILQEKPDFFLFENVKGLYSSSKHRAYFDYISRQLNVDYLIDPQVVNALWYKVPQHRERLIMIGVKKSLFPDFNKHLFHAALSWESFQPFRKIVHRKKWPQAMPYTGNADLAWPRNSPTGEKYDYIKELTVKFCWEKGRVTEHPNQQNQTKPRQASIAKFRTIPEGSSTGKSYHRLNRFKYAFTAAYGHNEVPLHPWEPRRISVAEALATQSLPFDFSFPPDMGISALFKAVGNGVPFVMAKGLSSMIYRFLADNLQERFQ